MPNLADSMQARQFVTKLETCESRLHLLTDWEQNFVADLRENFDSREDALDLGLSPWNPSASQSNTLSEIAERWSR